MRIRALFLVAPCAGLIAAGCGGSSSPPSTGGTGSGGTGSAPGANAGASLGTATDKVQATDDLKFVPATSTAKVGDIVEWDNTGQVPHTITFASPNDSLSDSMLNPSQKWQVKFVTAGTYSYKCTIHPGMTGTITVS